MRPVCQLLNFLRGCHAVCLCCPSDEALAAQTPPEDEDLEDLKVGRGGVCLCVSRELLQCLLQGGRGMTGGRTPVSIVHVCQGWPVV